MNNHGTVSWLNKNIKVAAAAAAATAVYNNCALSAGW